jgi:hypothetical protein
MNKGQRLEFDWDEHNIRHIRRHGVSPREFEEAMRNERVFVGVEDVKGEERWYLRAPRTRCAF